VVPRYLDIPDGQRREGIVDGRHSPAIPGQRWMGRLHLHLLDRHERTAAYLELSVRDEFVKVWQGNWTLAVMDRDRFRSWFWDPTGSFEFDDLVWTVEGTRLCLSIRRSVPFFVPETFVGQLVTVL